MSLGRPVVAILKCIVKKQDLPASRIELDPPNRCFFSGRFKTLTYLRTNKKNATKNSI